MIIYLIGTIGVFCFMLSYIPDTIKAIKSNEIKGVTISSTILLMFGLTSAIITNIYFKNYPFVINDILSLGFSSIILYQRVKKIK